MNKPEQHALDLKIYQLRTEPGLQAQHQWLHDRLAGIKWMDLTGEDLTRAQGEGKLLIKMIKMLEVGPLYKGEA